MTVSAFGIDHPDGIAKRESKPSSGNASVGRYVTGGIFPGFHGAIAGRKAKGKLKAAGLEVGGAVVGSTLPGPGTVAGGVLATHYGNKKGWYKAQQKDDVNKSAFGVEHDDVAKYASEPKINNYIRPKGERRAVRRSKSTLALQGATIGLGGGALVAAAHHAPAAAIPLLAGSIGTSMASNVTAHRAANKWRAKNDLAPRKFWSGKPDPNAVHKAQRHVNTGEAVGYGVGGTGAAFIGARHAAAHIKTERGIRSFSSKFDNPRVVRGALHALGEAAMLRRDRAAIGAAGGALAVGAASTAYRKHKSQ